MEKHKIAQDCRFFLPDAPCSYHKIDGRNCDGCDKYSPSQFKILIIKLGALGDVLRTTSICEPLKASFPESRIFWITYPECIEVLKGNRFIDKIITSRDALSFLLQFRFDLLICPELDEEGLILAGIAEAREKRGFWYDKNGIIHCSNSDAEKYFLMSHNDELKKGNRLTYQTIVAGISQMEFFGSIIVPVSEDARKNAKKFSLEHNLSGKKIIGAVVGTGNRWTTKRWPESHFIELFSLLENFKIIIFGGPEEKDILERIISKSPGYVVNAGHSNSIDEFFGLLELCDAIVTGDTFALHAALGLKKKTVALFGPTSSNEIEMYNLGEKIISGMPCVCCYRKTCNIRPNCMDMIEPKKVASVIKGFFSE